MDIHELIVESDFFDAWFNIHYLFSDKNISHSIEKDKLKNILINRILVNVINDKNTVDVNGIFKSTKKEIHIPIEIITLIKLIC
jgi:hypothetical protein